MCRFRVRFMFITFLQKTTTTMTTNTSIIKKNIGGGTGKKGDSPLARPFRQSIMLGSSTISFETYDYSFREGTFFSVQGYKKDKEVWLRHTHTSDEIRGRVRSRLLVTACVLIPGIGLGSGILRSTTADQTNADDSHSEYVKKTTSQ